MKELKELILPRRVAERDQQASPTMDVDPNDFSNWSLTQNSSRSSSTSDHSPVTPSFWTRAHGRYPSSSSSLASSPPLPQEPFDSLRAGKASLPDVKEEPLEKDEFDMVDEFPAYEDHQPYEQYPSFTTSVASLPYDVDYDISEYHLGEIDLSASPKVKKRRAGLDSPFGEMATRLGNRFPSLSRKWNKRKLSDPISFVDSAREGRISRSASTRSSSLTPSAPNARERSDSHLPPTPTKSVFDEEEEDSEETPMEDSNSQRNSQQQEEMLVVASTPLLPPLMVESTSSASKLPLASPLQSPTIADPADSFSGAATPVDTPTIPGVPSPPLSTKPSISSFHRSRAATMVAIADIPPIHIADPTNEWAKRLGHADFHVHPEPYLPETFDLESCRQMHCNWEVARTNYTKHLVRTGEHYGTTSKTYKLTEEKWAGIDSEWKKNISTSMAKASDNGHSTSSLPDPMVDSTSLVKLPSLNDPRSDGKFPKLGDEDIVGPMEQVASQLQRRPSRKAIIRKLLQDLKFPTSLMSNRPSGSQEK